MTQEYINKSIGCTIDNCKFHCSNDNFCSRKEIMIGTHEANPTVDQCTDCKSYKRR